MRGSVLTMARFLAAIILFGAPVFAQPAANVAQKSAKAAAPVDFTGYWVSPVMEDYRWRMITPLKGDAASVPINAAARKIVDAWDPAQDEKAGLQCKAYGAAAIMRVPGRLHITWADDNTLKLETDAGTQTRRFQFSPQGQPFGLGLPAGPDWQGISTARWWNGAVPPPPGAPLGLLPRSGGRPRTLEVSTTNMRAGYLRKNGVPYSDKTSVMEYFDLFKESDGETWFTVTTVVTDPVYLAVPFVTTTDFRKEADGSKFDPTPCTSR
jgi:hypothetical protein